MTKAEWSKVDWSLSNSALAAQLGVGYDSVRWHRKRRIHKS